MLTDFGQSPGDMDFTLFLWERQWQSGAGDFRRCKRGR